MSANPRVTWKYGWGYAGYSANVGLFSQFPFGSCYNVAPYIVYVSVPTDLVL